MARQQVGYNPGVEALQTTASPNIQTVQVARNNDPGYQAQKLAEALGATSDIIRDFDEREQERKLQEQQNKIGYYVEQFKKDYQGGAVTQAQIKERFPETVPVVAAKIAEVMGKQQAREQAQGVIQELMGNAELRLNTQARKEFVDKKRQELMQHTVGGINHEFYAAGYSEAMDSVFNQYEQQFLQETAAHHEKVQLNEFSQEIVQAVRAGVNPVAIDDKWKVSSLNNLQRNKAAIEAITQEAYATDNPNLLRNIPTRFLNSETKKQIADTAIQIEALRMTNFRNALALQDYNKQQQYEADQVEIIEDLAQGRPINAFKYKDRPQSYSYATQVMNMPRVDPTVSASRKAEVRSHILDTSTVSSGVKETDYRQMIALDPDMNPAEKSALLNEIPKLIQGRQVLSDPDVSGALQDRIGPRMKILGDSALTTIKNLYGVDPGLEIRNAYANSVKRRFKSYYDYHGSWPIGPEKDKIVEEEVVKAEQQFEKMTDIRNLQMMLNGGQQQQPSAQPSGESKKATKVTVNPDGTIKVGE